MQEQSDLNAKMHRKRARTVQDPIRRPRQEGLQGSGSVYHSHLAPRSCS